MTLDTCTKKAVLGRISRRFLDARGLWLYLPRRTLGLAIRAAEIETQGKCGGRVARAALFDAVTMASQNDESIGDAKAQRAARLAEQLNVEAETCMEVLSIVSEEISLQRRKAKLFLA